MPSFKAASPFLSRIAAITLVGAAAWPSHARAEDTVIKRFSNGTSRDSVGMIDAREDAPMDGPQAIYAAEDGSLYLLDQVNGRVLRFDAKKANSEVQSLELPKEIRPTDVVVRNGNVYVWDGAPQTLQADGNDNEPVRELTRTRGAGKPDDATLTAFAQMGSAVLDSPDEFSPGRSRAIPARTGPAHPPIATRGHGTVVVDVAIGGKLNTADIQVREQGTNNSVAKLTLKVRDRIGIVEFLDIDNAGRMFVLTENIPTRSNRRASAYVVRYSPKGVQECVYDIPFSETLALSRRFITISPDGDVYFLRTASTEVALIGVGSRTVHAADVIDNPSLSRMPDQAAALSKAPIAAVRALTRQKVIENAFAFEGVQWRVTPAVYGRDPDTSCSGFNRIRRPGYLSGKLNQEVRGVPYCWGCHGSLNQFLTNIANGMLAGNVCTHNNPRPDTTGVDCSAFVSAAWGLSTHFTTAAIPGITQQLDNAWDLQPGDALNKPGSHVMLFLRFTPDRKTEVMESSTGGCNGKVCRNVYPLSSLLARGYRPVRYRVLEDAPSAEAKVSVSLRDQQRTGEDGKSKTNSRKLVAAHNQSGKSWNSDDEDRRRVRHRRRHSPRD
jgi:streptogramin lyase